jgi:N-acetylglucosaminyldiphosphoundecaprenol N-acetyl-beta-D-mannosaminyltransferase
LPERVNILDFLDILLMQIENKEITVYLLGGTKDIAQMTEDALKSKGIKIVGSKAGFFTDTDTPEIIKDINILCPNILMVGMGVPKQEKWIARNLASLDVNLCWAVGAAFEWISGYRKRAPVWMIRCGMEWLHRLYQQPKRLWKRYLIGNPLFLLRVLKYGLKKWQR